MVRPTCLNAEFTAWAVQRVIYNNESFFQPLRHLGRLYAGESRKRGLIPVVVFFDVVEQWHRRILLYINYHIVKHYMIIEIRKMFEKVFQPVYGDSLKRRGDEKGAMTTANKKATL